MEKELIQQGDVLFFRVDELPIVYEAQKGMHPGMATFAEGEVTGHHHSAVIEKSGMEDNIALYEKDEVLYCEVRREIEVTHQEHKPVTLAPGKYRVGSVREYDPFENEIRNVWD
ncbi:MAG: hypothetical protein LBT97_09675 [Planctomycetota bacterium]|jgi:hypothetical protein|nr:hypothetical protein [Planctomycetota bacterium]